MCHLHCHKMMKLRLGSQFATLHHGSEEMASFSDGTPSLLQDDRAPALGSPTFLVEEGDQISEPDTEGIPLVFKENHISCVVFFQPEIPWTSGEHEQSDHLTPFLTSAAKHQ